MVAGSDLIETSEISLKASTADRPHRKLHIVGDFPWLPAVFLSSAIVSEVCLSPPDLIFSVVLFRTAASYISLASVVVML